MTPAGMIYEEHDGLRVATSGPVVINGVLHRVEARYVVCEPTLNRRAWNVTQCVSVCPKCYPDEPAEDWPECDAPEPNYVQGELFEALA